MPCFIRAFRRIKQFTKQEDNDILIPLGRKTLTNLFVDNREEFTWIIMASIMALAMT